MKLLIGFLFLTQMAFAQMAKVPTEWIESSSSSESSRKSFGLNQGRDEITSLQEGYQNLIGHKSGMLEKLSGDEEKKWYLQSIKTELGIEAKGGLGIMGAGGEAALELIWIRKKNGAKSFVSFNNEIDDQGTEAIQISSEMSPEALKAEIEPIVDLALKTSKIKKRAFLFKNLFNRALEFQKTIAELENAPSMGPWYAYKYQMELGVSVEGHITPFLEVGNALRLRMEWWKLKKKEVPLMLTQPTQNLSPNAKFVSAIAQDLSFIDQNYFQNGFQLNCMKVGVGTSVKGNLVIAKAQANAKGSIFFLRHEEDVLNQKLFPLPFDGYSLQSKDQSTIEVRRHQFRQAIRKSSNILSFFARHAPEDEGDKKYELNVIEAEFELFTNGGIGLVTVEGNAGLTLFATRNVII